MFSKAQVIYDLEWSTGASISGTGNMTIVGTPTAFSGSGTPSWLSSINLTFTINGASGYLVSTEDILTFEWSSAPTPTSASDITTFRLTANVSEIGSPNFDIAFGAGPKELTLIPQPSGSPQTASLTSFSAVPEPEEWAAIASSGLLAFALWHRRSRKAAKA